MKTRICALIFALALALAASPASQASRSIPLQDHQRTSFGEVSGRVLTPAKVREAIVVAASARGWAIASEISGQLTLRNNIRGKHMVVIKLIYDAAGVQVDYVSSENLNYELRHGQAYIHPKYNQWLGLLMQDVSARLSY